MLGAWQRGHKPLVGPSASGRRPFISGKQISVAMVAATHRLEAVDRQAATPMAVQAVMPQLAKTTVDQRVTKEWLTIAATIGFRRVIVTAGRIRTASRDNDNRDNGHRDHRHGHF